MQEPSVQYNQREEAEAHSWPACPFESNHRITEMDHRSACRYESNHRIAEMDHRSACRYSCLDVHQYMYY